MPYWSSRETTFYEGVRLVGPAAFDVSPVSTFSLRLLAGGMEVEQGETKRGRPLAATTAKAALRELVCVDALLKLGEVPSVV